MLRLVWKWKATVILVLVLSFAVFGGGVASDEDDCLGTKLIKDSGMAYYCLLAAHAFTDINGTRPAGSAPLSAAPLAFERNIGQADRRFDFLAHSNGGSVYLSKGGV